jgi:hypothetical protein
LIFGFFHQLRPNAQKTGMSLIFLISLFDKILCFTLQILADLGIVSIKRNQNIVGYLDNALSPFLLLAVLKILNLSNNRVNLFRLVFRPFS